jgi:hypothetical protein
MRTLPNAYDILTLDEIDAAIATFCDPLTADEVVALAQWWTLYSIRTTMRSFIPKAELALMAALGNWQEAWAIASQVVDFRERFEAYLAIYGAAPRHPDALTTLFFEQLEPLFAQPRITLNIADTLLRRLCQMGYFEMAGMFMRLKSTDARTDKRMILIRSYLQAGYAQRALETVFALPATLASDRLFYLSEGVGYLAALGDAPNARRWLTRLRLDYEQVYRQTVAPDEHGNFPLPVDNPTVSTKVSYMVVCVLGGYVAVEDWAQACHWLEIYLTLTRNTLPKFIIDVFARAVARTSDTAALFAVGLLVTNRIAELQLYPVQRLIDLAALEQAHVLLREMRVSPENCARIVTFYHQVGWGDQTLSLLENVVAQFYKSPGQRKNQFKQLITSLLREQHLPEALAMIKRAGSLPAYQLREFMADALNCQPTDATLALLGRWLAEPAPSDKDWAFWHPAHIHLLLKCFIHDADAARARQWYAEAIFRLQQITTSDQRDALCLTFAETLTQTGALADAYRWLAQVEKWDNTDSEVYEIGQQALECRDHATALACLELAQQRRRLSDSHLSRQTMQHLRDQWQAFRSAALPAPVSYPSALNAPQSTDIIGLWRSPTSAHVYHFLRRLPYTSHQLEAHTPGLYPRVLKACLEIVGNFAPEWATFVQTLDEVG